MTMPAPITIHAPSILPVLEAARELVRIVDAQVLSECGWNDVGEATDKLASILGMTRDEKGRYR